MHMIETEARKIANYYDSFSDYEVVFNHSVIAATGLMAKKISLKSSTRLQPPTLNHAIFPTNRNMIIIIAKSPQTTVTNPTLLKINHSIF